MKILNVDQNSKEWESLRRTKIGASEAPCICGVDPYKKPEKLFKQKFTGEKQYVSYAMNRGKHLEPIAREMIEKMTGTVYAPLVVQHDEHDWMIASLDGYSEEHKILIEIKCPGEKVFNQIIIEREIPVSYIYQIQHQLEVTGLDQASLVVFNGVYLETRVVERDSAIIKEILEKEAHFYNCLIYGEYQET